MRPDITAKQLLCHIAPSAVAPSQDINNTSYYAQRITEQVSALVPLVLNTPEGLDDLNFGSNLLKHLSPTDVEQLLVLADKHVGSSMRNANQISAVMQKIDALEITRNQYCLEGYPQLSPQEILLAAARVGHIDAMHTAIALGAKPNERIQGQTALWLACNLGQQLAIRKLRDMGAEYGYNPAGLMFH